MAIEDPNSFDEVPLPALARIRRYARQIGEATDRRDQAMREAREEGLTLREIAEAAGLTHTGVRKILAREPSPEDPPE